MLDLMLFQMQTSSIHALFQPKLPGKPCQTSGKPLQLYPAEATKRCQVYLGTALNRRLVYSWVSTLSAEDTSNLPGASRPSQVTVPLSTIMA